MHESLDKTIYRKITSNTVYSLKGSIVTNGSLFIMNLILSRLFPPLDLSLIFIVISITGIFMAISEMGIPQAVTINLSERISKSPSSGGGSDINSIIISSYMLGAMIGIILMLFLFLSSNFISSKVSSINIASALKMSSIWILASILLKISQGVFNGFQKMKYSFFLNCIAEPLKFWVVILALVFGFSWKEVIWGWTLAYIVAFLACVFLLFIFLNKEKIPLVFNTTQCKGEMLQKGLLLFSPILGSFLVPYILNLILAKHEVSEVSYFALSFSLTSVYFVIFNAFSLAFLPAATQLMVEKDKERLTNIVIVGIKYIGLGGFGILLMFYFFSGFILSNLYGSQYMKAQQVLILLAFSVFFDIFKTICDPLLMATGRGGVVTVVEWIKVGIILMFSSFAIDRFGLRGAGIALFVSFLTASSLKLFFIQRSLNIRLLRPLVGIGCLLSGLILYHFVSIPFLILIIWTGTIIYYFKLWVWSEVKLIWSLVRLSF